MKAYATLLLVALYFCMPVCRAQQVIWSENFELMPSTFTAQWMSGGWMCDFVKNVGTVCFPETGNQTKLAGISGKYIVTKNVCDKFYSNIASARLVTPAFNFSSVQHAALRYDSYFLKTLVNGKTESAQIEVSIDNGGSWQRLKNVPPTQNGGGMIRDYVDLSAYAGQNSVRIGFHYSDSAEQMTGWMIDNLRLFVPDANDVALTLVAPSDSLRGYISVPGSFTLRGQGRNLGYDTLRSCTISYQEAGSPVETSAISGLAVPPGEAFSFVHSMPYPVTTEGRKLLKCWLSVPGDTTHGNDSSYVVLHGARFIPDKRLVIEEGTGTWNIQAPRGIVLLHQLDSAQRVPTRISIHGADVMEQRDYSSFLYDGWQVFMPYFLFDRRAAFVAPDLIAVHDLWKDNFGFADLDINASALYGHIYAEIRVRPAVDMPGDYRLALVITESAVQGTTSLYDQANGYAGGGAGPMGGFESLPNPVPAAQMKYDYVARTVSPNAGGVAACLPRNMKSGQSYKCDIPGAYADGTPFEKLNAVVLLIRDSDSTILNSKSVSFKSLGVETAGTAEPDASIHPNPATDAAFVDFYLPQAAEVQVSLMDPLGRVCKESEVLRLGAGRHSLKQELHELPAGLYFLKMSIKVGSAARMIWVGKLQKL